MYRRWVNIIEIFKYLFEKLKHTSEHTRPSKQLKKINNVDSKLKEILNFSWEVEKWKYNFCFNKSNPRCKDCCSGGIMLGSFCKKMEEEYKKHFEDKTNEK